MNSFNLNYLLKSPSPNIIPLGIRASTYEQGVGHNSVQGIPTKTFVTTKQKQIMH